MTVYDSEFSHEQTTENIFLRYSKEFLNAPLILNIRYLHKYEHCEENNVYLDNFEKWFFLHMSKNINF